LFLLIPGKIVCRKSLSNAAAIHISRGLAHLRGRETLHDFWDHETEITAYWFMTIAINVNML